MERIGFVGIGLMGHGMAKNLLAKGYSLAFRVHRNRANLADLVAAGAAEVSDTRALIAASDIIFFCVTGSPQVEEIIYGTDGLLAAITVAPPVATRPPPAGARDELGTARRSSLGDGMMVVDCSTSEPDSTAKIRADLANKGVIYVDAPLARTPKEAEEGRLNTMVGADAASFERLQPVMKAFCENVIHVGPPGHGHVLKLVNNFLALSIATSTAEAFAIAAKSGLSLRKLLEVITAGGVNSGVFQMIASKAVDGDLAGMKFTIANGRKDMSYYTHLAESHNAPCYVGEAVHQSLVQAAALGLGERFIPSLLEAQEKLNGIKIVPR
ncbi:MAG: NAD(P)-dependent oxidoreductase [Pseudomonadota bacterium]|nr:NAD(P)-dependent oxidoreductase [Pseudomonadota bacterium]